MRITDKNHLLNVATNGIDAIEALAKVWLREDDHACTPLVSTGTGNAGTVSNPTQAVALAEHDRYRDRDRVGAALYHLVHQLTTEMERWEARDADKVSRCVNCQTGLGTRTDGRCSFCGPWFARQGRDRDTKEAATYWTNVFETRPCRRCDEPIKISTGRRVCDRCRKA